MLYLESTFALLQAGAQEFLTGLFSFLLVLTMTLTLRVVDGFILSSLSHLASMWLVFPHLKQSGEGSFAVHSYSFGVHIVQEPAASGYYHPSFYSRTDVTYSESTEFF